MPKKIQYVCKNCDRLIDSEETYYVCIGCGAIYCTECNAKRAMEDCPCNRHD